LTDPAFGGQALKKILPEIPVHPGGYGIDTGGVPETSLYGQTLDREAIRRGCPVLFITALNLIAGLARAQAEGRLGERLSYYAGPKLLILDAIGYLPLEINAANPLFRLVYRRFERETTMIRTDRSGNEWGEIFGSVVAAAILDRLTATAGCSLSSATAIESRRSASPGS